MARFPSLSRRTCPLVVAFGLGLGLTARRSAGAEARHRIQQAPVSAPVVHPARLHNTLINFGLKRRGLCYHWAEDLQVRLAALERHELVLRWVVARRETWREHNAILVPDRNREPAPGLVLDAWRHGGCLHWAAFRADKYPWRLAD